MAAGFLSLQSRRFGGNRSTGKNQAFAYYNGIETGASIPYSAVASLTRIVVGPRSPRRTVRAHGEPSFNHSLTVSSRGTGNRFRGRKYNISLPLNRGNRAKPIPRRLDVVAWFSPLLVTGVVWQGGVFARSPVLQTPFLLRRAAGGCRPRGRSRHVFSFRVGLQVAGRKAQHCSGPQPK